MQLFPWQFFPIFQLEKWIVRTIVAVLGKAMSESSFTIIFLYTAELFPTVVRSVFKPFTSTSNHMHKCQRWNDSDRLALSLSLSHSLRQNGIGFTSFVARLGVSISPLIMLLEDVWYLLPSVIYCAVAVGCGLVNILLPETLHTRLPETIEDIEKPRKTRSVSDENCTWMQDFFHNLE